MKLSSSIDFEKYKLKLGWAGWLIVIALSMPVCGTWAQTAGAASAILLGRVVDSHQRPVADAVVILRKSDAQADISGKTGSDGRFALQPAGDAGYQVFAEKGDRKSPVLSVPHEGPLTLVIDFDSAPQASNSGLEFTDQPHFSVAGVTDWTAAGGHGSDTILRTSESLTDATVALKTDAPRVGDASKAREALVPALASGQDAESFHLAGILDERLGHPLLAVQELARAATMDASEQNEFDWASELLLHRAISQAEEVFRKGVDGYPSSLRMQAGFGAALFAGSRYQEAALQLCKASDLDPSATSPYVSLGEIDIASPSPLECAKPKLLRFVTLHPESATANYLYAMALLKDRSEGAAHGLAKEYLDKAVLLDPTCGEAYLQLGTLAVDQKDYQAAIRFYQQAIQAKPELADSHYRLGVAYDRTGERMKAQQEFLLHQQLKQKQAAAVEEQRKTVKQFLFAKPDGSTDTPMP